MPSIFLLLETSWIIIDSSYISQTYPVSRVHDFRAFLVRYLCSGESFSGNWMSKVMMRFPFCTESWNRGIPSPNTTFLYEGLMKKKRKDTTYTLDIQNKVNIDSLHVLLQTVNLSFFLMSHIHIPMYVSILSLTLRVVVDLLHNVVDGYSKYSAIQCLYIHRESSQSLRERMLCFNAFFKKKKNGWANSSTKGPLWLQVYVPTKQQHT